MTDTWGRKRGREGGGGPRSSWHRPSPPSGGSELGFSHRHPPLLPGISFIWAESASLSFLLFFWPWEFETVHPRALYPNGIGDDGRSSLWRDVSAEQPLENCWSSLPPNSSPVPVLQWQALVQPCEARRNRDRGLGILCCPSLQNVPNSPGLGLSNFLCSTWPLPKLIVFVLCVSRSVVSDSLRLHGL